MSELILRVTAPPGAGSGAPVVQRTFSVGGTLTVQLSPRAGPVIRLSARVRFGDGGPLVDASFSGSNWQCSGAPPASVPAGSTVRVTVLASATVRIFHTPSEPDIEMLDAQTAFTVRLANPAPSVTIDPLPEAVDAEQVPLAFTLTGRASDPDANIRVVECALDLDGFVAVEKLAADWSRWQAKLSLSAGLHRFTVRALDLGGNEARVERFLTVRQTPAPPDLQMGSITSWTRLEPSNRDESMSTATRARVFDPLWLLARQWQIGEFQGADAGTPVQARARATSAVLSRCHFGELPANTNRQAPPCDLLRTPLQTMLERRRMRAADEQDPSMLPLAVDAGLHFFRMLDGETLSSSYRGAFVRRFALPDLPGEAAAVADEATLRFARAMSGRAADARRLAAVLRASGADALVQDPALQIAEADREMVKNVAEAWLAWYDSLFAEPQSEADEAWTAERLEYALTLSGSFSEQPLEQVNLGAREIVDGRLDWSSFDVDLEVNLGSSGDRAFRGVVETGVPAPVSFRGAPAVRFWEIEDARLAYGLVPVGPTDLAQMMLIEYAGSYGNDWYLLPMALPVASINRIDSLVVTDSFGVRTLLQPIGRQGLPAPGFSMWQHSVLRRAGSDLREFVQPNLLFLAPTIGLTIDGSPLEEVALLRDETANVAWAIEKSVESPAERARVRNDEAAPDPAAGSTDAAPKYRLSTGMPANWIPLLPVRTRNADGSISSRLQRGALLHPDGIPRIERAQGQVLNAGRRLLLHDEDVPREGVHLSKLRRMARWIDGSTWVWTAFRKQVGRGEGSSGLVFDRLPGNDGSS